MKTRIKNFKKQTFRTFLATAILLLGTGLTASQADNNRFMTVFSAARPPIGYTQFCRENPNDCESRATRPVHVKMDPTVFTQMDEINRAINAQITPMTDMELYGVNEYWTIPTTAGDCEDYVLLKRKKLMEAGWPEQTLLITVVRDEKGDGHAVLTVTTNQGDMILDNQSDEIKHWKNTPYAYVKRQSQQNPRMWVMVGEDNISVGVATARPELRN